MFLSVVTAMLGSVVTSFLSSVVTLTLSSVVISILVGGVTTKEGRVVGLGFVMEVNVE